MNTPFTYREYGSHRAGNLQVGGRTRRHQQGGGKAAPRALERDDADQAAGGAARGQALPAGRPAPCPVRRGQAPAHLRRSAAAPFRGGRSRAAQRETAGHPADRGAGKHRGEPAAARAVALPRALSGGPDRAGHRYFRRPGSARARAGCRSGFCRRTVQRRGSRDPDGVRGRAGSHHAEELRRGSFSEGPRKPDRDRVYDGLLVSAAARSLAGRKQDPAGSRHRISVLSRDHRVRGRGIGHRGRAARRPRIDARAQERDDERAPGQYRKDAHAAGLAPGAPFGHSGGDEKPVSRRTAKGGLVEGCCNISRMLHSMPRRRAIAGMAALGLCGLARRLPAAESGASKSPATALADRLAAYADGLRHDDLDAATIERVKSHFIDTIGCGIAAFDERPVRICRDVALGVVGGTATVIGTNRRTTPDLATFANGAAIRYYDLNDSYVGGLAGHPSDHIAACLAVAESERASAAELITAIVLAYEINCRLIDAFDVTSRGWDAPTPKPGGTPCSRRSSRAPVSPARRPSSKAIRASSSRSPGRPWSTSAPSAAAGCRFAFTNAGSRRTRPWSTRRPRSWRVSRSPRRRALSIASPRSKSRRRSAATSAPEANPRSGRRTPGKPPITACPISPRAPCSTAISRTTATRPRSSASRASSPLCARSR